MNLDSILILARKHLGKGQMDSSARSCLADAIRLNDEGNYDGAKRNALRSIAYSVGICHADYVRAFGSKDAHLV
jgi:hypothetical protein